MRDGLAVQKQEFSQDLKPTAEKVLIMLEEHAEIDGYYKRYISAQEITPLQKKGSLFEFLREHAYLRGRTTRHLTEFWHVEPEMAFYDLLNFIIQ